MKKSKMVVERKVLISDLDDYQSSDIFKRVLSSYNYFMFKLVSLAIITVTVLAINFPMYKQCDSKWGS